MVITRQQQSFFYAVDNNDIDTILSIIEKGININIDSDAGWSVFEAIVDNPNFNQNSIYLIDYLLDLGLDINRKDERGNNAILSLIDSTMLVEDVRIIIAKMLLKKGININDTNKYGQTPYMIARDRNYHKLVKLLINNGCIVDLVD